MPEFLTIPDFFPIEFSINWEQAIQQMPSILRGYTTPETVNGEKKSFNRIEPMQMQRITERIGKTRISEADQQKRWLSKFPYDLANILDEWDKDLLGAIALPTSEYVQSHAFAYNRACDQCIIDAALGTAFRGNQETMEPVVLPTRQIVPVDFVAAGTPANSGLTLAKLIQLKSLFGKNNVDQTDEIVFVYTQQQLDDMLATTQATDIHYNDVRALVEGQITRFLGMTWLRSQLLPIDDNGLRTCFAFTKRGVKFTDSGRQVHVDIRADLSHALQIRTKAMLGAARTDEKLVATVLCDENPPSA